MLYTSYFAKLKKMPDSIIPVAICAMVPSWYKGARYTELAPDYDMLMQWKIDHNDDDYAECFNNAVLNNLDIIRTTHELHMLLPDEAKRKMQSSVWNSPDWHIVLICYEKPDDFCHRHLVAEWLRKNGYKCEEWKE